MLHKPSTRDISPCRAFAKFPDDPTVGKFKNKSKFVIFICDIPEFGHVPISLRLMTGLAKNSVYPVYYYSVIQLMKDERNLKKMRLLALQSGQSNGQPTKPSHAVLTAIGCNLLMRNLFARAIRSNAEIMVIDYLSETFVDAQRLTKAAKLLDYNVAFLKKRTGEDIDEYIRNIVEIISTCIKYQNHAEIWCQREADRWWHELDNVYLPKENNYNAVIPHYTPHLVKLPSPISEMHVIQSRHPESHFVVDFTEQAEHYYRKLEYLASMLSHDYEKRETSSEHYCLGEAEAVYEEELNDYYQCSDSLNGKGLQYTLVVIDDFHFRRPGRPRLFEIFMQAFVQENIPFHVVPIGELVIMRKFQLLFQWFSARSDMDLMDTYSYLFLDAFNMTYKGKEKIVILDNIHEGIVMSSYYIRKAIEKQWEVIILKRDQYWPPNDEEIAQKAVVLLKEKYVLTKDNMQAFTNFSSRNYSYDDDGIFRY